MKCKKVRKHLQEYLEGTLESARKKKLEDHIKGCSSCKKEFESLKTYFKSMRSIESIRAPEGFLKSVRQRIEEAKKPARIIPIRIKVPLELAGAVAAIVIAVIVFRNILPFEISTLFELKSQKELQPPEEFVTPREPDTSQEKAAVSEPEIEKRERASELQPPEEVVTPQDIRKEDLIASLKEVTGDAEFSTPSEMESHERIPSLEELKTQMELEYEGFAPEEESALKIAAIEKQIPVELVLVLATERPESPIPSAKTEGVKIKELLLDKEAPQRAGEKDKAPLDEVPSDYESAGYVSEDYESFHDVSVSELKSLVKKLGGMVVSMEYTKDGDLLRYITIEIPREQINAFMNGLRELGEVKGETEELQYEGDMILFSIELSVEG